MPARQTVNRGQPLTAEMVQRMLDDIADLKARASGRPGRGIEQAATALAFAAMDPELFIPCRIVHVRLSGAGIAGSDGRMAYLPSVVAYHVVGIRRPGIDLDDIAPVYGRPVVGDEARIYPAGIGLVCCIVRSPMADGEGGIEAQLMLLPDSEVVARRRCDLPPAPALAPLDALNKDRKRLGLPRIVAAGGAASAGGAAKAAGGVTPAP